MWFIFLNIGTDRPDLKYLYKHVRPRIATRWYEIGLELLGKGNEKKLFAIKDNHNDYEECAVEMLKLWLNRKMDASWNQLTQALRQSSVDLPSVASKIENMLSEENDILFKGIITITQLIWMQ